MMIQHTPELCRCYTDTETVLYYPFIIYCPLHAAAPDLMEALVTIRAWLIAPAVDTDTTKEMFNLANAAICQARGEMR